jgi:flagella synthesis protein FlgN
MPLSAQHLASSIGAERHALGELTQLLRDEQRALVSGQLEAVAAFASPKANLVLQLSRCADERTRLLQSQGLTSDADGMTQLLRKVEDHVAGVIPDWQRLLDETKVAKQLNDTNGMLIASRMRGTQQALGVLLSAARIPGTYAADGTTVGLHGTNRLAVA